MKPLKGAQGRGPIDSWRSLQERPKLGLTTVCRCVRVSAHSQLCPCATSPVPKAFDDHLQGLAAEGPEAFVRWADHPTAQSCHQRPEHLVPLRVCAGAASSRSTTETVRHSCMGYASSHVLVHG